MRGKRPLWATALFFSILVTGCEVDPGSPLPAQTSANAAPSGRTLVARLVHVTDTHVVDTESPARFAGAQKIVGEAWRPYEAYSMQLFDGIIRAANRLHASGTRIDFLVHTGDACDNAQSNELQWLQQILAGGYVDPLSGPDDRDPSQRPTADLDPYATFAAEGLYQTGMHGPGPTIAWYAVFGNHETCGIGTFAIFETEPGRLKAALPWPDRPGCVLPTWLDPLASYTHGRVTPADPGPPRLLEPLTYVEPNPDRAYFVKPHYIESMFAAAGAPVGHGFATTGSRPWYSTSVGSGLRLIGLDTTDRTAEFPGQLCHDGAISQEQFQFLRNELDASVTRGELVVVAGHHPTQAIHADYGVQVTGAELRDLLNQYSNVILYLTGHLHRNRVIDRGGYLEIETCSTLDLPQEGRVVEIWAEEGGTQLAISYRMLSQDEGNPTDPLRALREAGRAIALADKDATARQRQLDPSGADPRGTPEDRDGTFVRQSVFVR